MTSIPVIALALLALAPAGAAQLTAKQADTALRAEAKDVRKLHAQLVKDRTDSVLAALELLGDTEPGQVDAAVLAAFTALESWQNGLFGDFRILEGQAMETARDLLLEYADGVALEGKYPLEFRLGTGRALDDLRDDMRTTQEKALAKVRKRLTKEAVALAKGTGALLSASLELATTQGNDAFTQAAPTGYARVPLVLHTVLALGLEGDAEAGTLYVAGVGEDEEAIEVRAVGEGGLETEAADFFELGSPYWHATLADGGDGLPAGNYLVVAQQGLAGSSFGGLVCVQSDLGP